MTWEHNAACRGADDPDLWFPINEDARNQIDADRVARAKDICSACPARERCLAGALERREQHGVWGGLTTGERRLLLEVQPETPKVLGSPAAVPLECVTCDRPMVRADTADLQPGFVRHAAKGVCRGCYMRAQRNGDTLTDPSMEVDHAKVERVLAESPQLTTTAERTEVIRRVLAAGGNDRTAARLLGMSHQAVFKHRERWLQHTITRRSEAVA